MKLPQHARNFKRVRQNMVRRYKACDEVGSRRFEQCYGGIVLRDGVKTAAVIRADEQVVVSSTVSICAAL